MAKAASAEAQQVLSVVGGRTAAAPFGRAPLPLPGPAGPGPAIPAAPAGPAGPAGKRSRVDKGEKRLALESDAAPPLTSLGDSQTDSQTLPLGSAKRLAVLQNSFVRVGIIGAWLNQCEPAGGRRTRSRPRWFRTCRLATLHPSHVLNVAAQERAGTASACLTIEKDCRALDPASKESSGSPARRASRQFGASHRCPEQSQLCFSKCPTGAFSRREQSLPCHPPRHRLCHRLPLRRPRRGMAELPACGRATNRFRFRT